jgi:restriction system protein
MARHRGLMRTLVRASLTAQRQAQRELERKQAAQRELERKQVAQLREQTRIRQVAEKARKDYERAQIAHQKEQARLYIESRQAHVTLQNQQLAQQIQLLEHLLLDSLTIDPSINIQLLKQTLKLPTFDPGPLALSEAPPQWYMYMPPEPTGIRKFLPGAKAKYAQAVEKAQKIYKARTKAYDTGETSRQQALAQMKADYNHQVLVEQRRITAQHAEIDAFQRDLQAGLPQAIVQYFARVLTSSKYPKNFPRKVKLTYAAASKTLVVEYDLPPFEVAPTVHMYKYNGTTDSIIESVHHQSLRKVRYTSIIAQITLRTFSELFQSDKMRYLNLIVFNGYVESIDKGTGKSVRACLVAVQTSRSIFADLNLRQVDPQICLIRLNASVSKSPSDLIPVRPISELHTGNSRFQKPETVKRTEQSPSPSPTIQLQPESKQKPELLLAQTNTYITPVKEAQKAFIDTLHFNTVKEVQKAFIDTLHFAIERSSETRQQPKQQLILPDVPASATPAPASLAFPITANLNQEDTTPSDVRTPAKVVSREASLEPKLSHRRTIELNKKKITKLQEESAHLQARLMVEEEPVAIPSLPDPVSATPIREEVEEDTVQSIPGVDENWQIILQQWQPEHWKVISLLCQEKSVQFTTMERKNHRPLSRLIDEINAPVDEQLGDLLIDPDTQILSPHLRTITEHLVHWYSSSI